jgi:hypothetical protein
MALSSRDGPDYTYGNTATIPLAVGGNTAVLDYNLDAGPNAAFQGYGFIDPRFIYQKDQAQGYTGKIPIHFATGTALTCNTIPIAQSASNIASVAGTTSGTALALLTSNVAGVTLNVPVCPIGYQWNAQSPVNCVALDFGFAFGNVTSGSTTITVANAFDFSVGMPLVIGGVGNSGGTACLMTTVVSIPSTTTITVANAPLASANPTPIGMGNIWGPAENVYNLANSTPTAAQCFIAGGPGIFLDPRQSLSRGLRIVGAAGGAGGTFSVAGYDIYGMPMHETITVGAGAVTGWGVKAWKYIASITPNFTDAHAYTVGTSDVFGYAYRVSSWEATESAYNGAYISGSTGTTLGLSLLTTPTATTADVRGTVQTSTNGGGSAISGGTASTGTISSLALSGVRLYMAQNIPVYDMLRAFPGSQTLLPFVPGTQNPQTVFGPNQF